MSLRVAYVIFYVSFLSIMVFFQFAMGQAILGLEGDNFLKFVPPEPTGNVFFDAITFAFRVAQFGVETFGFLVQININPAFLFLNIFIMIPLGAGFLWTLLELVRGN